MSPTDVIDRLGDASATSRKSNPLQLKYGGLRLVFWKAPRQRVHQLCEIVIALVPDFEPLPNDLRLTDFGLDQPQTERAFRSYMHRVGVLPVHMVDGSSGRKLLFISGVSVLFTKGRLHSIRLAQKSDTESGQAPSVGEREPSTEQISEMLEEAERVMDTGALRSALLIAWAGLEAALRRVATAVGLQGRVGVQPSILIRELLSAGRISSEERDILEELRQMRTATAHGLAPIEINAAGVFLVVQIGKRLLQENAPVLRKLREVEYIMTVEAIEAYSVLASARHCNSLAHFLRSHGLTVNVVENAIGGDDPQHDIQVRKSIDFQEFNRLLSEWKKQYAAR